MYKCKLYPANDHPSMAAPTKDYAPESCSPALCLAMGEVPDRSADYAVDKTDFIGNQQRIDNLARVMKAHCRIDQE